MTAIDFILKWGLMPSTGPKTLCAGPNFMGQTKNLHTFCTSPKHFTPKDDFHSANFAFVPA